MIYLLTAILSMSGYLLGLKLLEIKNIPVPQAVMANYALAFTIAAVNGGGSLSAGGMAGVFQTDWWYMGVVAGVLYFASMNITSVSMRSAGVSATTIASRTSLIVPIIWSFLIFGEHVTAWQWAGIALVLIALVLIFGSPSGNAGTAGNKKNAAAVLMPAGVFITMGAITISMKSAQHMIRQNGNYAADYPIFELLLFGFALLASVIYYWVRFGKKAFVFNWRSLLGGLCLGAFNYLITIGIMHGLRFMSTSAFYALYNICVVVITTIAGILIFKDKPGRMRIGGICLAVVAIAVLSFLG